MSQTADERFDPVTVGWMIKIYLDLVADYLIQGTLLKDLNLILKDWWSNPTY